MAVDSISFGRFASESLSWEKWSSFSHNRYMEEVEKYSVPGSVAQKKAFFEAYYKRKRSQIATESIDMEREQCGSDDTENCDSEYRTDDHVRDSENASAHKTEKAQERLVKMAITEGGKQSVSCNASKEATVVGEDEVVNSETKNDVASDGSKTSPDSLEDENHTADVELQISGKLPFMESFDFNKDYHVADPPNKKSPRAFPQKSQISGVVGRPKKTNASPARPSKSPIALSKKENSVRNGNCFASCTPNMRNEAALRSKKMETEVASVRGNTTPSKRLDMSLSMSSGEACETTPMSNGGISTSEKNGKRRGRSSYFGTPDPCSLSEPSRPSAKETINNSPTSFATKMNRLERSPLKYSCLTGIKANCKNWSSSFRLRTEERAEKRKEFFAKLQEKAKAEEAEKLENQHKKKVGSSHALRSTTSIKACCAKFTRKLR